MEKNQLPLSGHLTLTTQKAFQTTRTELGENLQSKKQGIRDSAERFVFPVMVLKIVQLIFKMLGFHLGVPGSADLESQSTYVSDSLSQLNPVSWLKVKMEEGNAGYIVLLE